MSGEAQCYCCEPGVPSLDRALDELGMLAAVPAGRRQHQAETRRRRRYTMSAVQRRSPAYPAQPLPPPPPPPSGSAQIAEQMSRIRLDGGGSGVAVGSAERHAFETLYINWDYVSGVGVGPRGPAEGRPAGGKARRAWTRPAKPYSVERPSGARARTSSWSQQELAGLGTAPPPPGAENKLQPPADTAPAPAPAAGPLVRSLSLENLKLGEISPATARSARIGPDVENISRRIEGLRVEYQ